jgi:hypothetical protein
VSWFSSLAKANAKLAAWRAHHNEQRQHSALDDRTPAAFAKLHGMRFALHAVSKASSNLLQGFASPAEAALDSGRYLPEDDLYEGEALLRIAQSRDSLLSLWSNWKAHEHGLRGPQCLGFSSEFWTSFPGRVILPSCDQASADPKEGTPQINGKDASNVMNASADSSSSINAPHENFDHTR